MTAPAKHVDAPPAAGAVAVDHVVVGAGDLGRTVAFFEAVGLSVQEKRPVDADVAAELHGLPEATEEVVLSIPGTRAGVRVVRTPLPQVDRGDFFRGGHAIDFYTTDMEASVIVARRAGATVGPVADYGFGPLHLTQVQAVGPDGVDVVFVGIAKRLPSVLDARPKLLHSDVHSVVASVDNLDAETTFWTDVAGLDLRAQFPIDVQAVSDFMMLPRHAPVRMSVMTGPAAAPPRFELLTFDRVPGRLTPSRPLTAGALLPVFTTPDLDATVARMTAGKAETGTIVPTDGTRACWLRSPGGVDAELRERRR